MYKKEADVFMKTMVGKGKDAVLLEVRVPAGTKGIYIGDNIAFVRHEDEFLLAHSLKYRVVDRIGDRLILEVIP